MMDEYENTPNKRRIQSITSIIEITCYEKIHCKRDLKPFVF